MDASFHRAWALLADFQTVEQNVNSNSVRGTCWEAYIRYHGAVIPRGTGLCGGFKVEPLADTLGPECGARPCRER
jgi:hypothetical protein